MGARTQGKHTKPTSIFTDALGRARRDARTISATLVFVVGSTALGLSTHEPLPNLGQPTSSNAETQKPEGSSAPSPSAAATTPAPTSPAPSAATSGTTAGQPTTTTPAPTSTAEPTDGPDADAPHKPGKPTAPPGKAK